MKPRVLISDALSPAAVKIFQERGIDVDIKTGLKPDELKTIIGDYDGLAIRSATKVTKEILEAAAKLKVVGRAGIGVDNVDIPSASARGVIVMNTPFGNSITTAEHAIAMMFALARQLPAANASTHAGKWEKSRFMGVELTGKTLGIIGSPSRHGRAVAQAKPPRSLSERGRSPGTSSRQFAPTHPSAVPSSSPTRWTPTVETRNGPRTPSASAQPSL